MNSAALILCAVAVWPTFDQSSFHDGDSRLLAAIAQVETGNNPNAVGRKGERGIYQILPTTWAQYSKLPVEAAATDPGENDRVAREHLATLRLALCKRGLAMNAHALAGAWNLGEAGVMRSHNSKVHSDYADRVVNLMEASR